MYAPVRHALKVNLHLLLMLVGLAGGISLGSHQQDSEKVISLSDEETVDYYEKWLHEDVTYIISEQEEEIFNRLSTPEEKDHFIEEFWRRRNSNSNSPGSAFKEEHYRRIAYSNENFTSGIPGWMTDRGRVYIIHGPPDEIQSYPGGGAHLRSMEEGGGITSVYPFEIWRYRHLEGIGSNVELEFVNKSLTGDYRLSWNPNEKETDPLPHSIHEFEGLPRGLVSTYQEMNVPFESRQLPLQFQPFERYLTFAKAQKPPVIQFFDLKQIVETRVGFDQLPVNVRQDLIRLSGDLEMVLITGMVDNRNLTFHSEAGFLTARVRVYGSVKGLNNQMVTEFEEDLYLRFPESESQKAQLGQSLFQKKLFLEKASRYKLTLVVQDHESGNIGMKTVGLITPNHSQTSTLILADRIHLDSTSDPLGTFMLGDRYVRPSVRQQFRAGQPIWAYFEIYQNQPDQVTQDPAFEISYRILDEGEILSEIEDPEGRSIAFASSDRVILIHRLYRGLEPGQYEFAVEIRDLISERVIQKQTSFQIREEPIALE